MTLCSCPQSRTGLAPSAGVKKMTHYHAAVVFAGPAAGEFAPDVRSWEQELPCTSDNRGSTGPRYIEHLLSPSPDRQLGTNVRSSARQPQTRRAGADARTCVLPKNVMLDSGPVLASEITGALPKNAGWSRIIRRAASGARPQFFDGGEFDFLTREPVGAALPDD
jgi:hypothetical protein